MKKLILIAALLGLAGSVLAQEVTVGRAVQGSGEPGATGVENAVQLEGSVYHAPQYLPGYPTAATIYPRVVDVPCTQTGTVLNCRGYNWSPNMGRGEYLMVRPVVVPQQVEAKQAQPKEVIKEVRIIQEVPVKRGRE